MSIKRVMMIAALAAILGVPHFVTAQTAVGATDVKAVQRVSPDAREKVQLWAGGPYWATTNIGAEKPEEYGYYFWWGDTVGYKREGDAWVAADGSSSKFSFGPSNAPTYDKDLDTLKSEGWVVSTASTNVFALAHDAAKVHWGGKWRMPTFQELSYLNTKCRWTWTTQNGVNGYIVRGMGNSIFLPCAGYGYGTSLYHAGSYGYFWSSIPAAPLSDFKHAWYLFLDSKYNYTHHNGFRLSGFSIRPVQD